MSQAQKEALFLIAIVAVGILAIVMLIAALADGGSYATR